MVSPNMNVTFSKARLHCAAGPLHSVLACLHCVVGLSFLCSTVLCCGAIHSICHFSCLTVLCCRAILSSPDGTVIRGYSLSVCQHCAVGTLSFIVYGVPAMSGSLIFVEYYLLFPGMIQVSAEIPASRLLPAGHMGSLSIAFLLAFLVLMFLLLLG